MTKQDIIREGLEGISVLDSDDCDYEMCKKYKDNCRLCRATLILEYLHSQGCRIEVDRELPENPYPLPTDEYDEEQQNLNTAYHRGQHTMLKAGYVAVEPLVFLKK